MQLITCKRDHPLQSINHKLLTSSKSVLLLLRVECQFSQVLLGKAYLFTICQCKPFPPPPFALFQRVLPSLMHGEAVNIDMAFMTYVAHTRGLITAEEKEQIIQCMRGLELPVWHSGCSWSLIKRALMERLKHSGGQPRMPLPTGLGVAGTAGEGHGGAPGSGRLGDGGDPGTLICWKTGSAVLPLCVSGFAS